MSIEYNPALLQEPLNDGETDVPERINPRQVGRRLEIVRVVNGNIGPAEIADRLRIDRSNWTKYEKGERLIPLPSAVKVADAFEVSMDYIYLGDLARLPHAVAEKLRAADSMVPLVR